MQGVVHSVEEYECADTSIKDGKVVAQHNEYSIHSTPSTPLQVDIYLPLYKQIYTNPFTGRYIPTPLQVDIYLPLYRQIYTYPFTDRYIVYTYPFTGRYIYQPLLQVDMYQPLYRQIYTNPFTTPILLNSKVYLVKSFLAQFLTDSSWLQVYNFKKKEKKIIFINYDFVRLYRGALYIGGRG